MKYTTGSAFRQALEARLNEIHQNENIPLVRLRKQVAFERFIFRLQAVQPDTWILKGGLAMQLRLGIQSRTTKDIDLLKIELSGDIHNSLVNAASLDARDWFTFEVMQTDETPEDGFGGSRFHIQYRLDGRLFEAFSVDVGIGDLLLEDTDCLVFDPVLTFAGIASTEVQCYPITQQIAEKLHALTREYKSGESTRAKDFVDILLLASLRNIKGAKLSKAVRSTFKVRATHDLPKELPPLPKSFQREYSRMARELSLVFDDFDAAENALTKFINPVLQSSDPGRWDAKKWTWK